MANPILWATTIAAFLVVIAVTVVKTRRLRASSTRTQDIAPPEVTFDDINDTSLNDGASSENAHEDVDESVVFELCEVPVSVILFPLRGLS